MNKQMKIIASVLAVIMMVNTFFPSFTVLASDENSSAVCTGEYQYSASEGYNIQNQNTFVYHDECFTRSSFLGCKHLEELSIQVAASSISWYGETEDPDEISPEDNGHNLVDFLSKMAFEDVETNTYYNTEKRENSVGVAVGHKTIIQDGNQYTLLAVIPRSAGYKQEWAGNFAVGGGDIHEGFKASRDEILRFVKKYITEYQIEGSLKVWICGYSRGAAISDMLGGFFAGGGIVYFGENVSITPEDVYCYTIGTPKTIKDGLSKNIELSVAGNREEPGYRDDTPGEAFTYTGGGTVTVGDAVYGGLHNLISPLDSFPLLPLAEWGFTRYGNTINPNENITSEEDVLEELKSISPYWYEQYTQDGESKLFLLKTFDFKTLDVVETGEIMTPSEFMQGRLQGLLSLVESNELYVSEHYQDALKHLIGAYGMGATFLNYGVSTEGIDTGGATEAVVFACLSYASDALIGEGKAENEEEGIVLAIKGLLEYILEEEIDMESFTLDEFVALFAQFITENEAPGSAIISTMANNIPEDYQGFLVPMFGAFHKDYDITGDNSDLTVNDVLKEFIKACYLGADPDCSMAEEYEDPAKARGALYQLLAFVLSANGQDDMVLFLFDSGMNPTGPGLVKDFMLAMLQKLMVEKNDVGEVIKEYQSVGELADDKLIELIETFTQGTIEASETMYGEEYRTDFENHINGAIENIENVRKIISALFFYNEGELSVEKTIKSATTFVENAMQLPIEHFDEIYLAKVRNTTRYEEHLYHTVTLYLNNGKLSEGEEETIEVADSKTIEQPSNPTRLGYRFGGWYQDEKCKNIFNFSTPIIDDIIIYAKWNKRSSGSNSTSSKSIEEETTLPSDEMQETNLEQEIWSNADEWAKEELTMASEKQLIPETLKNKDFSKSISRKDFAAVCVKLYEAITNEKVEGVFENPFKDTNDEYVLKAYSLGITKGISETEFGDGEVTREQMATMLTRVLKKVGINTTVDTNEIHKFEDDGTLHDWGRDAVYFMFYKEIIKGVGGNIFNSLGSAKIEEAIAIALRCVEVYKK